MIEYINKVGKSIPNTLKLAQNFEHLEDTNSLVLYGYYEDTGFRGFFRKVRQGIKVWLHK